MNELIEQVHFETIRALSDALDARDRYTAGHSRRVMEYSAGIAKKLRFSQINLQRLKKSALLHDIGKIGVPDFVLHKQSKLSDEEFALIKAHPEIGAKILKAVKSFRDLVPAIYCHHERFDGKGYPRGVRGEHIPLHARIIAVADTFDAMTSDRSYRMAFPRETALVELEANKGTQFDPHIADVFIEMMIDSPDCFEQTEPEYYL
jgi:putative nucleotidyltransferase with HDIG domain